MSIHDGSTRSNDPTTQLLYSRTPLPTLHQHVHHTIHQLDTTHKGYLTRHDLKCAIILLLGYTPTQRELSALLAADQSDAASQRRLSVERCVAVLTSRLQQQDDLHYYQQLFGAFDSEGRGFIRKADFLAVCDRVVVGGAGGGVGGREVLERVFDVCDVDGDGVVSYREFDRLMSNRPYATM